MSISPSYDMYNDSNTSRSTMKRSRKRGEEKIRCTICLEHVTSPAYCDPCMHVFCTPCIIKWSKSKENCPQCRERLFGVIFNVHSDEDYDELLFNPEQVTAGADKKAHASSSRSSVEDLIQSYLDGADKQSDKLSSAEKPKTSRTAYSNLGASADLNSSKSSRAANNYSAYLSNALYPTYPHNYPTYHTYNYPYF